MAGEPSRKHLGYSDGLNLALSLCLTYSVCVAGLRTWIRRGNYGSDDLVILIATIITIVHIVCAYIALRQGLGQSENDISSDPAGSMLNAIDQATLAAVVTFAFTLYLSKCAVLTFLARITKQRRRVQLYHICNGIVAVIGLASIFMLTVDCPSDSDFYWAFYKNRGSCPSQSARWQVFTLFDILTELLLIVLPTHLICSLQMPTKRKTKLLTAFYLRSPVIGLSIGRYYYTLRLSSPDTDYGLVSTLVMIWIVVQLTYALASSTISALKTFTESFNSGFGLGFARNAGEESYGMSNVSNSSGSTVKREKRAAVQESAASDSTTRICSCAEGHPVELAAAPVAPKTGYQVDIQEKLDDCEYVGHLSQQQQQQQQQHPALRLRPDSDARSYTQVSADPGHGSMDSRHSGQLLAPRSMDDMVIIRETEYSVEHQDQMPILPRHRRGGGYS
ncbi:hypothetical protein K431DRAFT_318224 [Polychaeton citri CBS 116435]|uniref:Rhodopsin domain-containing protein n=1 Tax=Polychaeton citri CBS 116435 TaxID=1314669 RepID=A0A9P4QDK1_9PEZI|nr:hypothetical protein K431DRAFT_318224 [Polychaeton citri CBS 116435]